MEVFHLWIFTALLWSEYAFALQCLKGLLEKHNIFFVST